VDSRRFSGAAMKLVVAAVVLVSLVHVNEAADGEYIVYSVCVSSCGEKKRLVCSSLNYLNC